jgi:hypothetical protein
MGDDASFPEHMFDIFNVRNVDRAHRETYFLTSAMRHPARAPVSQFWYFRMC